MCSLYQNVGVHFYELMEAVQTAHVGRVTQHRLHHKELSLSSVCVCHMYITQRVRKSGSERGVSRYTAPLERIGLTKQRWQLGA